MKRIAICFFLIIFSLTFASCTNKPNDISEQHIQYGTKAVEIADYYLDYELSADEASVMLDSLRKRENELPDTEFGDKEHSKNSSVESNVLYLQVKLLSASVYGTSKEYEEVLNQRNEIAEYVGLKKR